MNQNFKEKEYKPGYYGKKRQSASTWTEASIKKWSKEQQDKQQEAEKPTIHYSICFSRQIGVGALEIADLLSEIIHYRVVDREIIEHMAQDTNLSKKVIEFYDERYPGKMSELFSMLISERTFIKNDYVRQLVKTINTLNYRHFMLINPIYIKCQLFLQIDKKLIDSFELYRFIFTV